MVVHWSDRHINMCVFCVLHSERTLSSVPNQDVASGKSFRLFIIIKISS